MNLKDKDSKNDFLYMKVLHERIIQNYSSTHSFNKHLIDVHYVPKTDSKVHLIKQKRKAVSTHEGTQSAVH